MKKSFKKFASLTIIGGVVFSLNLPSAFADDTKSQDQVDAKSTTETQTTVQAGITPDQFLYFADKLFEKVQLVLTSNEEKRAKLLASLSSERKAELMDLIAKHKDGELTDEDWKAFADEVATDYQEKVSEATDTVSNLAQKENDEDTETVNAVNDTLNEATDVDTNELKDDEEVAAKVEDTKAARTVVVQGYDPIKVKELRDKGYGYGEIAHIFALADASQKSIDEIESLVAEKKGFGKIAKELGLSPSVLGAGKHIKEAKASAEVNSTEEQNATVDANDEENQQVEAQATTEDDAEVKADDNDENKVEDSDEAKAEDSDEAKAEDSDEAKAEAKAAVKTKALDLQVKASAAEKAEKKLHGKLNIHAEKGKEHKDNENKGNSKKHND